MQLNLFCCVAAGSVTHRGALHFAVAERPAAAAAARADASSAAAGVFGGGAPRQQSPPPPDISPSAAGKDLMLVECYITERILNAD